MKQFCFRSRSERMCRKHWKSHLFSIEKKMKLYKTIQRICRLLGIDLQLVPQKYMFNVDNLRCVLLFGSGVLSSICHTFYSANTFEEYIASFYVLSSMLICFTIYSFIIWKIENLIKFYTDFKSAIHTREY